MSLLTSSPTILKRFLSQPANCRDGYVSRGNRRENPVVCQWVKREPQIGSPDRRNITVNHAERYNLSVRLFNRRFTRKTMGFSKKLRNHKWSVALQVAHFNFCRVHSAHKQTPAMAQGITDHVWTVAELLSGGNED